MKVNSSAALVALPPSTVVTVMSTVPFDEAGVTAVIDVSEFTVKLAETVPKSTADAPVKPVPVIVMDVPPATDPVGGVTAVTVGAAT